MRLYITFFLLILFIPWAKAQDIIDLGQEGGTCEMVFQSAPIVEAQVPQTFDEPSFSAHLEKWKNGSYTQPRGDMLKPYIGKSIFVFGASDEASEAAATKVKADIGLCVDYIVQAFDLKSYPVLVKVKEDTVEYSTDF